MTCQPCCLPQRLELIQRAGTAHAIEWIEVLDQAAPAGQWGEGDVHGRKTLERAGRAADDGSRP